MLLYGHFGVDATPESQRADLRSRVAIGLFVFVTIAGAVVPGLDASLRRHGAYALIGVLLAYLGWQRWQYTVALDELAQRLYLEAFAITYLFGLILFSALFLMHEWAGWTVTPLAFLVLEPVRAGVLVWRTRRYA